MRTQLIGILAMVFSLWSCGPQLEGEDGLEQLQSQGAALSKSVLAGKVTAYATSTGSESGAKQTFGPGMYHATAGELDAVGYDQVRLLELAPAMRVRICHEYQPTLASCEYAENLTGSNKRVAVTPPVYRLDVRGLAVGYREPNFGGVAQGFEVGIHQVSKGQLNLVGNDTISSVRLAPGLQVQLCSDNPETTYNPACRWIAADQSQVASAIDNSTSWIQVLPQAIIYRDVSFSGPKQTILTGVLSASELSTVGNDAVSSLTLHEGMDVKLCSDDPWRTVGYTCFSTRDSNVNLPTAIDNRTSWVQASVAAILLPLNEEQFVSSQTVQLRALVRSAVDGPLSGASVSWRSDRDGNLGTGTSKAVRLSVDGCRNTKHRIYLSTIDSTGYRIETFRDIWVRSIC